MLRKLQAKFYSANSWLLSLPTAAVLVPIQALGIVLWWVAGSYLGIDVFASRSFLGEDGWCTPATSGLGVHCWGDYYYPLQLLGKENPFDNSQPNPYPAASLFPFLIFEALGNLLGGSRTGLVLYLSCLAGAITTSVWFATKELNFSVRIILTTSLTWLAPPVLIIFDRGNSSGFLVPGLIWFFATINSGSLIRSSSALVFVAIIKPHFALLSLVYLFQGRFRHFLMATTSIAFSHLLAFWLLRPSLFPQTLIQWLDGLKNYQDYTSVSVPYPINLSFAQSLYAALFGLKSVGLDLSESLLASAVQLQGLVGPSVLLIVISMLTIFRKVLTGVQSSSILIATIAFGSATTFAYYAVVGIPIALALQPKPNTLEFATQGPSSHSQLYKKIDFTLWVASITCLVQVPIFGLQGSDKVLTSYTLLGGIWLVSFGLVFYFAFKILFDQRRASTSRSTQVME